MENKITKPNEIFVSEEEKILNWSEVQSAFEKNFGTEVYSSWLKNITLLKEYNDYLILGVPTLVPGMSCITKTVDINNISFLTFNNT